MPPATHKTLTSQLLQLLRGKAIANISVRDDREILLVFEDGTRLFINVDAREIDKLDISVTAGARQIMTKEER